ncbi:MAG: hypothetical protein AAGH89_06495, partial [Verrucomicrobiota bacterium]
HNGAMVAAGFYRGAIFSVLGVQRLDAAFFRENASDGQPHVPELMGAQRPAKTPSSQRTPKPLPGGV